MIVFYASKELCAPKFLEILVNSSSVFEERDNHKSLLLFQIILQVCFKMKPMYIVPSGKSYVKEGVNRIFHGKNYHSHTEMCTEYLYYVEHLYCFLCFKMWLKVF